MDARTERATVVQPETHSEICAQAPFCRPEVTPELAGLLEAAEGDLPLLCQLIGTFLKGYPRSLQAISAAVGCGSAERLERTAHGFKGSLGLFSRSQPLSLVQRLVEMGERCELAQAPATIKQLEGEMAKLAASLEAFVVHYREPHTAEEPVLL